MVLRNRQPLNIGRWLMADVWAGTSFELIERGPLMRWIERPLTGHILFVTHAPGLRLEGRV